MGELGLNKIFAAVLAAALVVMGLQAISGAAFSSGGHGGHHGEEDKPYGEAIKERYAYWTDVTVAEAGGAVEELPVDVGTLLVGADASKGERVFKSVCSSCHTINAGGADGTGPNLHGIIGRDMASIGGFSYSSALSDVDGAWGYETLNEWILDPKNIARGVNMVANVKKDPDRANLIAYLAENSPSAPAFPEPAPVGAVEDALTPGELDAPATATGELEVIDPASVPEDGEPATEGEMTDEELDELEEIVEDMGETLDSMEEVAEDAVDAVTEEATDLVTEDEQ